MWITYSFTFIGDHFKQIQSEDEYFGNEYQSSSTKIDST